MITVPAKKIVEALDNSLPNDIAEIISPSVHGGNEGGASAIILSYKGVSSHVTDDDMVAEVPAADTKEEEEVTSVPLINNHAPTTHDEPQETVPDKAFIDDTSEAEQAAGPGLGEKLKAMLPLTRLPSLTLNRQKKLILAVAFILLGLLIVSIVLVQKNSQASKDHALFETIYTSAKKDYDEGEGLISLNKSLARDDYESARKTLDSAQGKFKPGSEEEAKIKELSDQVDKRLAEFGGSSQVTLKEVEASNAPTLEPFTKDSSVLATTSEDTTVYTITSKSILKDSDTLVKNDSTWSDVKALGVFSGNLYVLDPKNGLIKFVPAGNDYAQSTYFKGDAPDLTKATGMAIDSSIYLLFSDGSIQKYTRGSKDSFTISGLSKSLSNPVSIFTSPDVANIYVLDPKNNRVVKFDKSGAFSKEYDASQLSQAKALTVSNDEKTADILIGSKVYELSL